jgi:hypothetical protein
MASSYRICKDCGRYFEHCSCPSMHVTRQGWPYREDAEKSADGLKRIGYEKVSVVFRSGFYRIEYEA